MTVERSAGKDVVLCRNGLWYDLMLVYHVPHPATRISSSSSYLFPRLIAPFRLLFRLFLLLLRPSFKPYIIENVLHQRWLHSGTIHIPSELGWFDLLPWTGMFTNWRAHPSIHGWRNNERYYHEWCCYTGMNSIIIIIITNIITGVIVEGGGVQCWLGVIGREHAQRTCCTYQDMFCSTARLVVVARKIRISWDYIRTTQHTQSSAGINSAILSSALRLTRILNSLLYMENTGSWVKEFYIPILLCR